MKNKYEGKFNEIKEEVTNIKSTDEKFLEKLENIVKNKIAESDLSVETISQEIGISRSQLQRKLKQLTNQNPSDYIKTTRLRHAAWLLSCKNFERFRSFLCHRILLVISLLKQLQRVLWYVAQPLYGNSPLEQGFRETKNRKITILIPNLPQ